MNYLLELFDKKLLDIFNKDIQNKLFDRLFPLVTKMGETVVFLPLCILILILDKKKGNRTVALLVIAHFLSRFSALALKGIFLRPRPFQMYQDLHVLGAIPPFSSFPSGHVTSVTALAFILGSKYENWQWLMWIAVALVAVSRMYMGMHYPIDVVAGVVVGLAIGYFIVILEKIYDKIRRKQ